MEAKAVAKYIRISPRKVRIVMNLIRGKNVADAFAILKFTPKAGAQGPPLKRIHPRSRGQAFKILKRTSHVTIVVKEK